MLQLCTNKISYEVFSRKKVTITGIDKKDKSTWTVIGRKSMK